MIKSEFRVKTTMVIKARTLDEAKFKLGRLFPNINYPTDFHFMAFPTWVEPCFKCGKDTETKTNWVGKRCRDCGEYRNE